MSDPGIPHTEHGEIDRLISDFESAWTGLLDYMNEMMSNASLSPVVADLIADRVYPACPSPSKRSCALRAKTYALNAQARDLVANSRRLSHKNSRLREANKSELRRRLRLINEGRAAAADRPVSRRESAAAIAPLGDTRPVGEATGGGVPTRRPPGTAVGRALRLADDVATVAAEYRSLAAHFMAATAGLDDDTCEDLFYDTDLSLLGSLLLHAAWSLARATGSEPAPLARDERLELLWRFDWGPQAES